MARKHRIKRNDPCPCGSPKKFKHYCEGLVDWNEVFRSGADWRPYLSVRGRNIHFANRISEALQLDELGETRNLRDYKAAFTADAVRRIHEAVMETWPPGIDIVETLGKTADDVTGIYVGDYGAEYLIRALVRHSIYANKLILLDPFVYPTTVRDEYNPILNPEQYRVETLKNVNLYFTMLPWIEAGIVELIRTPADFDHRLNFDSIKRPQKKFEHSEELKKASQISVDEFRKRHGKTEVMRNLVLSAPDSYLRNLFSKLGVGKDGLTEDEFIESVNELRDEDPYFLEPLGTSESHRLHSMSTGANYEIAKLTAGLTGSYLVTDVYSKWREIELDRENVDATNAAWSPFAKAMQNARLKYLNRLDLHHALTLRTEGRLEELRAFLYSVWKQACTAEPFDEANAASLANQLVDEVRKADEEWKQIDRDLIKIVAGGVTTGLLTAGPLIDSGHGDMLAAAAVVGGGLTLFSSTMRRRGFKAKFPAAFFLNVD